MKLKQMLFTAAAVSVLVSCGVENKKDPKQEVKQEVKEKSKFNHEVEQFADIKVLRYQIPGFEELTLKEKELVYYLTQAGLAGRDIMWDQNYRHNLEIRKALENINNDYKGDRDTDDFKNFKTYLKRVWFSNGIHHHYSNDKLNLHFLKNI